MSRSSGVKDVFGSDTVTVKSIKPHGDCFYEALAEAFLSIGLNVVDSLSCASVGDPVQGGPDPHVSPTPGAKTAPLVKAAVQQLRNATAEAVTQETFELFQMYNTAGLDDYSFMRRCRNLSNLKDLIKVCGNSVGAGSCVWANEFELSTLSAALRTAFLVLDLQATGAGRYVSVGLDVGAGGSRGGPPAWAVVLQRTRRQHYNLILFAGAGALRWQHLPDRVRHLWGLPEDAGPLPEAPTEPCAVSGQAETLGAPSAGGGRSHAQAPASCPGKRKRVEEEEGAGEPPASGPETVQTLLCDGQVDDRQDGSTGCESHRTSAAGSDPSSSEPHVGSPLQIRSQVRPLGATDGEPSWSCAVASEDHCWGCGGLARCQPWSGDGEEAPHEGPVSLCICEWTWDEQSTAFAEAKFCGVECIRRAAPELVRFFEWWKSFRRGKALFLGSGRGGQHEMWAAIIDAPDVIACMKGVGWRDDNGYCVEWMLFPDGTGPDGTPDDWVDCRPSGWDDDGVFSDDGELDRPWH